MARVNVYLPDDLAQRVKERGIQVSPVCQRALEKEVNVRSSDLMAEHDVERIITRLRDTQSEDDLREQEIGRSLGGQWAREVCTLKELETVAGNIEDEKLFMREGGAALASHIWNADEMPEGADLSDAFSMVDYPRFDAALQGATDVYNALQDRLYR